MPGEIDRVAVPVALSCAPLLILVAYVESLEETRRRLAREALAASARAGADDEEVATADAALESIERRQRRATAARDAAVFAGYFVAGGAALRGCERGWSWAEASSYLAAAMTTGGPGYAPATPAGRILGACLAACGASAFFLVALPRARDLTSTHRGHGARAALRAVAPFAVVFGAAVAFEASAGGPGGRGRAPSDALASALRAALALEGFRQAPTSAGGLASAAVFRVSLVLALAHYVLEFRATYATTERRACPCLRETRDAAKIIEFDFRSRSDTGAAARARARTSPTSPCSPRRTSAPRATAASARADDPRGNQTSWRLRDALCAERPRS